MVLTSQQGRGYSSSEYSNIPMPITQESHAQNDAYSRANVCGTFCLAQLKNDSLFRDFPQQTSCNISKKKFLIAEKNRASMGCTQ